VVTERLLFTTFSRPANGFTGRGSSGYKNYFWSSSIEKNVGKHCGRRFQAPFPVERPTSGAFPLISRNTLILEEKHQLSLHEISKSFISVPPKMKEMFQLNHTLKNPGA